ncbi:MAG: hypothetical protein O3B01_21345 [Planctomycetota bacterium]|nr:hypothetical protein [Planctomycetota bacterium]
MNSIPQLATLLPCESLPGHAVALNAGNGEFLPRTDGSPILVRWSPRQVDRSLLPPTLLFIDLESGEIKKQILPNGYSAPWGKVWGPDGMLYMGLWGPAEIMRYDPAKVEYEHLGAIEEGERFIPRLTIGTDEKIYAQTGQSGHVFSYDPATGEIAHFGRQGPQRDYHIAYTGSIGVDDEYIYTTFGNVPMETWTVVTNKNTGEQILLDAIRGADIHQGRLGVTASFGGQNFWLWQGQAIVRKDDGEPPPWPERELPLRQAAPEIKGKPELLPNSTLVDVDGSTTLYYRLDEDDAWRTISYQVETETVILKRAETLPDGRIIASTEGYEGFYSLNPDSGDFKFCGIGNGSVSSVHVAEEKMYVAAYPGGTGLSVWDTSKPWNLSRMTPELPILQITDPESNPRKYGRWHRAGNFQFTNALMQGKDGTLYAALHGERHNVGGILCWWNLESGEQGHLREPFGLYDIASGTSAQHGSKFVYSSFTVKGLEGEPIPETARLFVFDTERKELDWYIEPFEGIDCTGLVEETQPGELLLATARGADWNYKTHPEWHVRHQGSILYKIDMKTRKVTDRVELPGLLGGRRDYFWHIDFRKGPDGMVYTFYNEPGCEHSKEARAWLEQNQHDPVASCRVDAYPGTQLVRIDPSTLEVTAIADVHPPSDITFAGRDIYVAGRPSFRVVRDALLL